MTRSLTMYYSIKTFGCVIASRWLGVDKLSSEQLCQMCAGHLVNAHEIKLVRLNNRCAP